MKLEKMDESRREKVLELHIVPLLENLENLEKIMYQ